MEGIDPDRIADLPDELLVLVTNTVSPDDQEEVDEALQALDADEPTNGALEDHVRLRSQLTNHEETIPDIKNGTVRQGTDSPPAGSPRSLGFIPYPADSAGMSDLATFGEGLVRLSPPDDTPLAQADTYDAYVGGAANNVAVAAASLGLEAAWLSKLAAVPQARHVAGELRRHGVDPAVVWTQEGRQGTYYLESGDEPRGSRVVYDRELAAVQSATAEELPTEVLERADAFHVTGITPALSATLRDTTADLLALARDAGTTTCFDLNYRSTLWSPAEAREAVHDLLPAVDWFVVAERDAAQVLERDGEPAAVATALAADHDLDTVVVTRGDRGAVAVHDGETVEQPAFPAGDAHPVGSGDAFVGGFLAERLQGRGLADALATGAATAALKRTIPGDMAPVSRAAVERVVAGDEAPISR